MADTEERSWSDESGKSHPGKSHPGKSDPGKSEPGTSDPGANDRGATSTGATTDAGEDDRTRELQTDGTPATPTQRRTPFTQQVGRAIMAIAAVLFGVFAVANVDSVTFNWIFGEGDVPLILLLLVSFGFGALIAWLATLRHGGRH